MRSDRQELGDVSAPNHKDRLYDDARGDLAQVRDDGSVARQHHFDVGVRPGRTYGRNGLDEATVRSIKLVALMDADNAHGRRPGAAHIYDVRRALRFTNNRHEQCDCPVVVNESKVPSHR